MKQSVYGKIGLFAGVWTLVGIFFSVQFYFRTKQYRNQSARLQQEMSQLQNNRNLMTYLINDCVEYGKTHPAIDPILASVGYKISRNNATAAKP